MCYLCYSDMPWSMRKEQIKLIENKPLNFSDWNDTSLSFMLLFLKDMTLVNYHYIIINAMEELNKNRNDNLSKIVHNSMGTDAHAIYEAIERQIETREKKLNNLRRIGVYTLIVLVSSMVVFLVSSATGVYKDVLVVN